MRVLLLWVWVVAWLSFLAWILNAVAGAWGIGAAIVVGAIMFAPRARG